ncbi:MAG: hypothetical protein C5S49_02870 [Candidatus Methanogaster sp.]|nr:MAG: hypothetical protein C5S49_02870 [ANME-2 cluster archaeon]
MTNVLTNPDRFFAELSGRDVNLRTPFAIVLVAATISSISAAMAASVAISALPEEAAAFAGIGTVIGAVYGLLLQFIIWLLSAGVFYFISIFFGGAGSFKRVLEFGGYGFIPIIVFLVIGLAVTMTVLPTIDFSIENPEPFQQTYMQNPFLQAYSIIGFLFMLWSANIWIFAVKHAQNISTKNALITVGVPVGLYLLRIILIWVWYDWGIAQSR